METTLIYIGKSAIAAAAFYLAFLLLFQNQKHFRFNRIYLPVSLALSFGIPLITFTTVKYIEPVKFDANSFATLAPASGEIIQPAFVLEWYHYLFGIYILGSFIFLFHLVLGHLKAISIIRKSRTQKLFDALINITIKDVHPFSFFSKIVISENTLDHPNLNMIVEHENIHVKEKHTLDILFAEILFLFQWFNPFVWLIKDAMKNNLEYLTDHQITQNNNAKDYQLAMVTLADKKGVAPFLNALNGNQLKNRIIMMKKKTENKYSFVKQLLILPLLAVLVMGLSNKVERIELIQNDQQASEYKESNIVKYKIVINGEEIPTNTPKMQELNLAEVLDVLATQDVNMLKAQGIISREILKVQNISISKFNRTYFANRYPEVSTLFIQTKDYVKGTNPEFDIEMSRDSAMYRITSYNKNEVAVDNNLKFKDFKIVVDGKTIPTDIPEFNGLELTDDNNYNGKIVIEIIEALELDLDNIKSSSSSNNPKEPFVYIKTKDYVEGTNPEFEKLMIHDYVRSRMKTGKNENHEPVFTKVDVMPEFPGGEMALNKFITYQTKYPEIAKENGIEGKVYVTFVIDRSGKVINPEISRGVDPALDKEALRVVSSFPDWKPGKQNGKPVNVSYTVPITFGSPEKIEIPKGLEPLFVVDGIEKDNIEYLGTEEIESISVLKDESATSIFGKKGKNGVVIVTTKGAEVISSELDLRKFIAKRVKYPVSVQENNIRGKIKVYAEVNSMGIVTSVSEKQANEFEILGEVVITSYAPKNNSEEKIENQNEALTTEAKRIVQILPKIEIPELKGKTVEFTFNFTLQ